MPRGPKGEKRPADVVSNAVLIGRIATGEAMDSLPGNRAKGGKIGGKRRAEALSAEERRDIASLGGRSRVEKNKRST